MKKFLTLTLTLLFLTFALPGSIILAEDYSDREKWISYCQGYRDEGPNSERYKACVAFYNQAASESHSNISNLQNEINELKKDLSKAQKALDGYIIEIEQTQVEINELTVSIKELGENIKKLEEEIEENRVVEEEINAKVTKRMSSMQGNMHFNPFLEFILGAEDFTDMLRRGYGLQAITKSEEEERLEVQEIIDKLNIDREKVKTDKQKLDEEKTTLVQKEKDLNDLKEFQIYVIQETNKQVEEKLSALEEEKHNYKDLIDQSDLAGLPSSEGLISPIPGARVSAGCWYYPASFGGGIHLGVDFAVGKGTQIYAPANGVVLVTSNGCGDGYLGCECGSAGGGAIYGGNQVYLIMSAGGKVYGVLFAHLLNNSIAVSKGEIVMQGDPIAKVGSSGNSTGPHSHVELFYLGEGDMEDLGDYLNRNYSLSFNCGWGRKALERLCENGVGAPCRLDPRKYFGS